MLTWDDVWGRVIGQNTPQPVNTDSFAQIYGNSAQQNLPDGWWGNPFYSNLPGWGKNPNDGNSAMWNPDQYTDSSTRDAAWAALGRPSTDYLGRTVTAQDGGGVMTWNGKPIAPNTNNGFAQAAQAGGFMPAPAQAPAQTPASPQPTTQAAPSYGASAPPSSSGEVTMPAATNTASPTSGAGTANRTGNQTVLGGQLNADLTVSNPRRRVANAMIMRR